MASYQYKDFDSRTYSYHIIDSPLVCAEKNPMTYERLAFRFRLIMNYTKHLVE